MMYKDAKRKTAYVCDMKAYNNLSERVKNERGEFFSKLVIKADENGYWDEIEYVMSHIYFGTWCRGEYGDLGKMSEAALRALSRYDGDIDVDEIPEILGLVEAC